MENKTLSTGELLKFGYAVFKNNWKFLIGIVVLGMLTTTIPAGLSSYLQKGYPLLSAVLNLVYFSLSILVGMGLVNIALKFTRNEVPTVKDLFNCGRYFFAYLGAQILFMLITLAGLILLLFPAFIWGTRYALFPYFIIEKNQGPVEALQSSAKVTFGAKWDYLAFWLTTLLLNIGALACLGLGIFVAAPITAIANALAYRKLLAQTP